MIAGKETERERRSRRETETQWGPRKENVGSPYTEKMSVLKVTATLWKTSETWLGIKGCFGALPPSRPICPSDALPFLFPRLSLYSSLRFLLSQLLSRFSSCPETFVIPLLNAFFPSAQVSTCQISLSFSYSSCIFVFSPLPSNLILLSVRQDKLSEEVQKQHDGPEENGSPPATQAESDNELPANADPDASQAEEDKDKTKPLLERLKALEVTTSTRFSLFSLCLCCFDFPFVSLRSTYSTFFLLSFSSCLFILLHIHPLQPPLAILCGLACLPVVRVLAQSHPKAWQLIKFSSVLRLESKVILWESPRGPQAVLQLRFVFLCARGLDLHSAVSPEQQPRREHSHGDADCFILLKPLDTHPLRSLQQLKDSDLIKLGLQSYRLILMLLHVTSPCCCGGRPLPLPQIMFNWSIDYIIKTYLLTTT